MAPIVCGAGTSHPPRARGLLVVLCTARCPVQTAGMRRRRCRSLLLSSPPPPLPAVRQWGLEVGGRTHTCAGQRTPAGGGRCCAIDYGMGMLRTAAHSEAAKSTCEVNSCQEQQTGRQARALPPRPWTTVPATCMRMYLRQTKTSSTRIAPNVTKARGELSISPAIACSS